MRILFAFTGGHGHVQPLIPIATAARDRGHVTAFAGRPSILPAVEELGFAAFGTEAERGGPPKRIPLQEVDVEREQREFREWFAGHIARERAARMLEFCEEWRPDVVVCEETDFGSMIASERLGLPYAIVLILGTTSFSRPELIAESLNTLRAEHGLPPDPELTMLRRHLVLSSFPHGYRDPVAHSFRVPTLDPRDAGPPWPVHDPNVPTVYFTLGTVFNLESGDLFTRVLTGLRSLPIEIVVTVGHHVEPDELGPLPDSIHVAQYIPQSAVLPHCSAVVSHGGSGSVVGTLAHGLPSVLIPMGADQSMNATRCEELGVARILDPVAATPETVREAVAAVLAEPSYRAAAERLRDEIAALPGPEHAVALVERAGKKERDPYPT